VETKNFLLRADVVAENRLRAPQRVRRDDEAFGAYEAEPELVVLDDGVGGHADYPEIGQR
jgi:hypothetical protein